MDAPVGARSRLDADSLVALLDSADRLASTQSLDQVLHHILTIGGELTRSEGGSVILHDAEADDLFFAAATGPSADKLHNMRLPLGHGKVGAVFASGTPLIENTVKNHYQAVDTQTKFVTRSIICVALRQGERIHGVLQFVNKDGGAGEYDGTDLEQAERLAKQAVVAIRNATLFERMLAGSGLYGLAEDRDDLIAMVTGDGPSAKIETATVMFGDLRGFSLLCGALKDPARIQAHLSEFLEMLALSVLAHHGIVNNFLGDGVMALFRGPDAPLRAVKCAFDMRERFGSLRDRWQPKMNRNLKFLDVGVGIASDEMIIGIIGDNRTSNPTRTNISDFTLIGEAVNLAAALERKARDGHHVLCDIRTYEQVKSQVIAEGPVEQIFAGSGDHNLSDYLIYSLKDIQRNVARKKVFVCHSTADIRAINEWIMQPLETHGFEVFLAEQSIPLGHKWDEVIGKAISACDYFLVVLSGSAAKSSYVKEEIFYAFNQERLKPEGWIMPLLVDGVDPGETYWRLERRQFKDLTTAAGRQAFEQELKELTRGAS